MPRKNRNRKQENSPMQIPGNVAVAEKPTVFAEALAAADALKASGGGNLSAADLAAIRGEVPAEITTGGVPVTEGQGFTTASEMLMAADPAPVRAVETPPEILSLTGRVLTLEHRVAELTAGLEQMAQRQAAPPVQQVPQAAPVAIRPPTPQEAAAYNETNFALSQDGLKQHNGLQAWRDAGSPVLKANPVPAKGKAA